MAGYDWKNGMSNNAVNAYENGEKPISKWSKLELETVLESFGFNNDELKLKKSDLADILLERTSWHHTSKFFNETDFYSVIEDLTKEEIDYEIWKIKNPEEYEMSRNAYVADEKAKERTKLEEIKNNMKIGDLYVDFSYNNKVQTIYRILDINEYGIQCQVIWHYRSIKKFEKEFFNDYLNLLRKFDMLNMEFDDSDYNKLEYDLTRDLAREKQAEEKRAEINKKISQLKKNDLLSNGKVVFKIARINKDQGTISLCFEKQLVEGRFVKFSIMNFNEIENWSKYENQN